MTDRKALKRLGEITDLILTHKLSELEAAARAREESLAHLRDLEVTDAPDISLAAAGEATLRYERWAEKRRAEINRMLARQTASWLEAQDDARLAFGRAEALKKLSEKKR